MTTPNTTGRPKPLAVTDPIDDQLGDLTDDDIARATGTRPRTVTITELTCEQLVELLGWCEEFFRTGYPRVHSELVDYLDHRRADPGCFIDMLGFNHAHLQRELAALDPTSGSHR